MVPEPWSEARRDQAEATARARGPEYGLAGESPRKRQRRRTRAAVTSYGRAGDREPPRPPSAPPALPLSALLAADASDLARFSFPSARRSASSG